MLPTRYSTLLPYTTLFRSVSLFDLKKSHEHVPSMIFPVLSTESSGRTRRPSGPFALPDSLKPLFTGRRMMTRTLPPSRSEEHTSELQSLRHLVCRLLLEKK